MSTRGEEAKIKRKVKKNRKEGRKNNNCKGGEVKNTDLKKYERRDILNKRADEIQAIFNRQKKRREGIDKQIKGITFKSDELERKEKAQRIVERAEIQGKWDEIKKRNI